MFLLFPISAVSGIPADTAKKLRLSEPGRRSFYLCEIAVAGRVMENDLTGCAGGAFHHGEIIILRFGQRFRRIAHGDKTGSGFLMLTNRACEPPAAASVHSVSGSSASWIAHSLPVSSSPMLRPCVA